MDLKDYFRIARQRWMTIAIVTLIAIGLGTLMTLRTTPLYTSTARLFISTSQSDSVEALQGGQFALQRVKSYADLVTGEEISRRVVEKLDLDMSPQALAGQISAVAKIDTVVLSISVTDADPKQARILAQTVSQEFVRYVKELETPEGKSTAPVKASIVDKATEPGGPVSPNPTRNLALATMLGLLLGAGIALLRDSFDTTVKTSAALETASGNAPLLGSIYFDKNAPKYPLITSLSSHAPRTESFRVLRTNLQFVNVDSDSKVYVVTSALPGEGKSTTTVNLAITLAESGEKVILLEGDLRRPKAISYLKLEGAVGVTTVLVGRIAVEDAIQGWAENLDVLAAGSTPPNPAELLQSKGMKNLLASLREDYDIVLIDAPPLLPVADAALLSAVSDGAILVVNHGSTTKDQVEAAVGRLESVDARLIGTIINKSPEPKRGRSGYGYGYGYGYAPEVGGRAKSDAKQTRKQKKQAQALLPKNAPGPAIQPEQVAAVDPDIQAAIQPIDVPSKRAQRARPVEVDELGVKPVQQDPYGKSPKADPYANKRRGR